MSFTKKITKLLKKEVESCILKLQEGGKIGREESMEALMKICFVENELCGKALKSKEDLKLKSKEDLKLKEDLKAAKLKEKEEAKALKLKEKEEAKALKLKEKEKAKALKLKEKEDLKAAKLKEKETPKLTVEEAVNELVEESMSEDDDEGTQVMKFEHKSKEGQTLWIDEEGHIFDDNQEHIGNYDEELDVIYDVEK
jgi:hypothetical protein